MVFDGVFILLCHGNGQLNKSEAKVSKFAAAFTYLVRLALAMLIINFLALSAN